MEILTIVLKITEMIFEKINYTPTEEEKQKIQEEINKYIEELKNNKEFFDNIK